MCNICHYFSGYLRSLRTSGSLSSMPVSSSTTLGTNSTTTGTGSSALVNSLTDNTSTSPAYRQSYRSKYLRADDGDKQDDSKDSKG